MSGRRAGRGQPLRLGPLDGADAHAGADRFDRVDGLNGGAAIARGGGGQGGAMPAAAGRGGGGGGRICISRGGFVDQGGGGIGAGGGLAVWEDLLPQPALSLGLLSTTSGATAYGVGSWAAAGGSAAAAAAVAATAAAAPLLSMLNENPAGHARASASQVFSRMRIHSVF